MLILSSAGGHNSSLLALDLLPMVNAIITKFFPRLYWHYKKSKVGVKRRAQFYVEF